MREGPGEGPDQSAGRDGGPGDLPPAFNPGQAGAPLAPLRSRLERIRVLVRTALIAQRTFWVLAGFLTAAVAGGAFDYILRTPAPIRAVVWLGVAGLVVSLSARWIWPAIRFKPTLTQIALRVERAAPAGDASAPGSELASGLELADELERDPSMNGRADAATLAAGAVRQAAERAKHFGLWHAFRWAGTLQATGTLALLLVITLGLFVSNPRMFSIGARRVLLPWTSAPWPKRTGVVDATAITAHPIGSALPIRAAIYRTNKGVGRTDVRVAYRVLDGFAAGPVSRALLTGQGKSVPVIPTQADGHDSGELYERLIEAGAIGGKSGAGRQLTLEYWFETDDDQSDRSVITLVDPPAVLTARASLAPPEYAAALAARFTSGSHDLGAGHDEKATIGPVLAGSHVTLTLDLNKPLVGKPEMLGFGPGMVAPADASLKLDGSTWIIDFTAEKSMRLPIALVDEFGIPAAQDAVYTLDVAADAPPTAAVLEPSHDETVLASAIIESAAEGRDDVGLSFVELRTQKAIVPAGSAGAPPTPTGEPTLAARVDAPAPGAEAVAPGAADPSRQSIATSRLVLKDLGLKAGDELWLTAIAKDIFALNGSTHAPVTSQARRLRVISESEFVEQLQSEMNGLRQAVQRLDDDQKKLQTQPLEKAATAESQHAQQQITERLTPTHEAVQRLIDRVDRNGLQDAALKGILQDAKSLSASAAERSSEAQAAMERAAQSPTPDRAQALADAQQRTHEELNHLIDSLERGKDNWAARRDIERLLQSQKELRQQTTQATNELAGKQNKDLSPAERSALDALAQRQKALAEQTAANLDSLGERAQRLKQTDPVQSEAIQSAAQRGRQDRVADQQQQAAEQLKENRTQQAGDQQDQAIKSLEKMLNDLDQGAKKREQTLHRMLADLTQQLEELIERQKTQIASLTDARTAGSFDGLDAPMLKINQDTLGISQRARTAFKELERIVKPLSVAAKAQSNAIAGLRAQPPDPTKADTGERLSLDNLTAALELARKSEDDAQQQDKKQKLQELKEAYAEALARQILVEQQTAPYIAKDVGRRERAAIRDLAERQRTIRDQLQELRTKTSGLKDAGVFDFAHARLDQLTAEASKLLDDVTPTAQVARDQAGAKRLLKSLVDALAEQEKKKDFRENEGDEDSGGGGGGANGEKKKDSLIPPLAELKLLRDMQAELADMTKALADTKDAGAELDRLGTLQQDLAKQAADLAKRADGKNQKPDADVKAPGEKPEGKPPEKAPGGAS